MDVFHEGMHQIKGLTSCLMQFHISSSTNILQSPVIGPRLNINVADRNHTNQFIDHQQSFICVPTNDKLLSASK